MSFIARPSSNATRKDEDGGEEAGRIHLILTKWGFGHHEATLRMNIRPDEVYSIMKHDVHPIFRYVPERKTRFAGRGVRLTIKT